jgi:pilus assembly protein CpaE
MADSGALDFYHLPVTPAIVEKILVEAPQLAEKAREIWRKPLVDAGVERTVIEAVQATAYQRSAIAFWSLKGGDGKTTLAVNTACLLSQVAGKKVLLIDADRNCGRVALQVGIPPEDRTLVHLASDYMVQDNRLDAKMLRRRTKPADPYLDHRTKVVQQCTADELRGKQGYRFMEDLIKVARGLYDFVVLDLGSNTELAPHKAALLSSDQVMFVNTSDRTSLLHNKDALDYLAREHDVPVGKFKLLVNRYHPDDRIDLGEVPKVMGMPIIAVVPEDLSRTIMASVNAGRPFVLDHMGRNSDSHVEGALAGLLDIVEEIFPPMSELIQARRRKAKGLLRLLHRK